VRKESTHPRVILLPNRSLHSCNNSVLFIAIWFAALLVSESTRTYSDSTASSWCRPRPGGSS
jgi:hypothetical protein